VSDTSQGTEAWRQSRCGLLTASNFKHVIARKASGDALKARQTYMRTLAFERISQVPVHELTAKSLAWGKTNEGRARTEYEIRSGNLCTEVPLLIHPDLPFVGASPDGLVGDDGGIEIKCPISEHVHIGTWIEGMPEEHVPQVQGAMFVTGRRWWDFVSSDPRLGDHPASLYVERITRDDVFIRTLEDELWLFELELRALVKRIVDVSTNHWREAA
jgi:predicted phage-related endonuclease